MPNLSQIAIIIGALVILPNLLLVVGPEQSRHAIAAFPRHEWAGRILAGVDIAWAARLVYLMPLGWFDEYKWSLYVLAPLLFVLVIFLMDELLAPRALGGLLLLLAAPILNSARWHPSAWRLIMVALAYAGVIVGMMLVVSPYRFRKWARSGIKDNSRARLVGSMGTLGGLGIVLLGLIVY